MRKKNSTNALRQPDLDSVEITLPNGKKINLYGDAAHLAREEPSDGTKVLRAMAELLRNPETPRGLFEAVAEFSCAQSNQAGDDLYHSDAYLDAILKSVQPDERRGAVIAGRTEEVANAAN